MYILWSFVAALMMALTAYFTTFISEDPYTGFFFRSFSYLMISGVVLTGLRCRMKQDF